MNNYDKILNNGFSRIDAAIENSIKREQRENDIKEFFCKIPVLTDVVNTCPDYKSDYLGSASMAHKFDKIFNQTRGSTIRFRRPNEFARPNSRLGKMKYIMKLGSLGI